MEPNNHIPSGPGSKRTWAADFLASVVVFLVALPLCIGIAQASGLPPEAGLVTGIIGGLLVGLISGSPLQVSGPAAGLIVLVIGFLADAEKAGFAGTAGVALLGLALLMAGGLQVAAGVFKFGQWFRAVSPAVVGGMLAGIGVTIIAKQFHVLVDDTPPAGVVEGLLTIPQAIWKGFVPPPGATANHTAAAFVGLLAFLVLVFWKSVVPKWVAVVPSAVIAVVLAVLVAELARFNIERVTVSANLLDGLAPVPLHWPGWGVFGSSILWTGAITFALIASAETMLCAVAVDTMHTGPRTRYDRELIAQGVGNMACGALGALPMTGVIVRSSANVDAGARTRFSSVLHGVWLLLAVVLLADVLSLIPLAALAAVLVYTGWKLVNLPGLIKLWKESWSEGAIYVITAATIVGADLLTGVVTGVVLSAAKLLWVSSHLSITRTDEPQSDRVHLHLEGAATFLRLPQLSEKLEAIPPGKKLHVHLDGLRFLDHAVLHLFMTFQKQYEVTGGRFYVDWERLHAHFRNGTTVGTNGRVQQDLNGQPVTSTGELHAVATGLSGHEHKTAASTAR
jgi:MFS superfamily sulfate permease-like transporter